MGGQAAAGLGKYSYIEYCWRVISSCHTNFYNILNYIGIKKDAYTRFTDIGFIKEDKSYQLSCKDNENLFYCFYNKVFKYLSTTKTKIKMLYILSQSKDRITNEYQDTPCSTYSNNDPIISVLIGPIWGTEPAKTNIPSIIKNSYAVLDVKNRNLKTSNKGTVTINPSNIAYIDPWENYLIEKNVTIHKKSSCTDIIYNDQDKRIESITINDTIITGDHFIFCCSLQPLNKIIKKTNLYKLPTFQNMIKLENCLQIYFAFNVYFKSVINNLEEFICIVDMPWQPIIQRKIRWGKNIMNVHSDTIKEVWNVGVSDYYNGKYNNKILRDCSIEEAINEALTQIANCKYIKEKLGKNNMKFKDIYIGTEYWPQYYNRNGKIWSHNPKFSPNAGYSKYMPATSHPVDIPSNMSLSAYYVQSNWGGASMEASCELSIRCANEVLDKYILPNKFKLYENNEVESILPSPLDKLNSMDKTLYQLGLPNIIICFVFLIIVMVIIGVLHGMLKQRVNKHPILKFS